MNRLVIVCEGQTEREFCNDVLRPFFANKGIDVSAPLIKHSKGGIVAWSHLKKQIENHLHEGAYVSTFIDYYGIKRQYDFPGWDKSKEIADKRERLMFVLRCMLEDIPSDINYRFIPYIQLHEFEGLLFSDVSAFKKSFDETEMDFDKIKTMAEEAENPEMINDGPETAPSKRILKAVPGYDKVIYGNCLAMEIGLDNISVLFIPHLPPPVYGAAMMGMYIRDNQVDYKSWGSTISSFHIMRRKSFAGNIS